MFNQTPNHFALVEEQQWREVENLIRDYQMQFDPNCSTTEKIYADQAASELINRFSPLFKKYIHLLTTGQINWHDKETKMFISLFLSKKELIKATRRKKIRSEIKAEIYNNFNFILETYGTLPVEDIKTDLIISFLELAKRYKDIGKSFCAYVYNSYKFQIARLIKKRIRDPLSIPYKKLPYEDFRNGKYDLIISDDLDDSFYEDAMGIPDISWINGESCSCVFQKLSPFERKILIKYYLEYWSDRQIGEVFGLHVNTINTKRQDAIKKISKKVKMKPIRNRRSGKKAILPS